MPTMQREVYEAFRSVGVPEETALKAAITLDKRDAEQREFYEAFRSVGVPEKTALKAAIALDSAEVSPPKLEAGAEVGVKTAITTWMLILVLVLQVAIFFKVFIH